MRHYLLGPSITPATPRGPHESGEAIRRGLPDRLRHPVSERSRVSSVYYDKERLLAKGDRCDREIAKNIALDAPYR
jgi:hypothetical protein